MPRFNLSRKATKHASVELPCLDSLSPSRDKNVDDLVLDSADMPVPNMILEDQLRKREVEEESSLEESESQPVSRKSTPRRPRRRWVVKEDDWDGEDSSPECTKRRLARKRIRGYGFDLDGEGDIAHRRVMPERLRKKRNNESDSEENAEPVAKRNLRGRPSEIDVSKDLSKDLEVAVLQQRLARKDAVVESDSIENSETILRRRMPLRSSKKKAEDAGWDVVSGTASKPVTAPRRTLPPRLKKSQTTDDTDVLRRSSRHRMCTEVADESHLDSDVASLICRRLRKNDGPVRNAEKTISRRMLPQRLSKNQDIVESDGEPAGGRSQQGGKKREFEDSKLEDSDSNASDVASEPAFASQVLPRLRKSRMTEDTLEVSTRSLRYRACRKDAANESASTVTTLTARRVLPQTRFNQKNGDDMDRRILPQRLSRKRAIVESDSEKSDTSMVIKKTLPQRVIKKGKRQESDEESSESTYFSEGGEEEGSNRLDSFDRFGTFSLKKPSFSNKKRLLAARLRQQRLALCNITNDDFLSEII
ncbi:hypothetical protein BC829DRAFT_454867 [Chytridium lagenaria]|nr:hypothetical protein BC829DRAFT_454867 [Chytridium lagenaria]